MNDSAQTQSKSPDDGECINTKEDTHQHVMCVDDDDDDDDDETFASDVDAHQQPPTMLKHRQRLLCGDGSDVGRGDSKRKRSNDDMIEKQLSNFKNSSHSLRISASSVAALCGLHPFQNLPQLMFDLVYQSYYGQLLLQKDAHALGLILVDAKTHEQQTMLSLASSVSSETKALIQQVLEVSEGKRKLQSVEEVQSIQRQIKVQAMEAQQSGKLTQHQVESLIESSRGHVSTGFGTCHEEEALDIYEKRVGVRVRERNETLMEWHFQRKLASGGDSEIGVTASPLRGARRRRRRDWTDCSSRRDGTNNNNNNNGDDGTPGQCVDMGSGDDKARKELIDSNSDNQKSVEEPFFLIVGAVDGIRDELYVDSSMSTAGEEDQLHNDNVDPSNGHCNNSKISCPDNDEDPWSIRPIVVECKHRMKNAIVPPPIYDQIQTSLYCHMYNVDDADLIQVVRRNSRPIKAEYNAQENRSIEFDGDWKCKTRDIEITVTRVSLNDPLYEHRHHWKATLLPRLASFVDAVYCVRKDDSKRYRLLMALIRSQQVDACNADAEDEAWKVLWDECGWIRDCDTAFEQKRRWIQSKKEEYNIT